MFEAPLSLESLAILEMARFFASRPTQEQILAFHASKEVADRLYELIAIEKTGMINEEERRELDSYESVEHIIIRTKAEALRRMRAQAS